MAVVGDREGITAGEAKEMRERRGKEELCVYVRVWECVSASKEGGQVGEGDGGVCIEREGMRDDFMWR
jgi:hypothetical protein